jgi:hypothetical protein
LAQSKNILDAYAKDAEYKKSLWENALKEENSGFYTNEEIAQFEKDYYDAASRTIQKSAEYANE